jgi:hypothetical protein
MTAFIPGEYVDITIKGARVEPGEDVGLMPVSVGNWRTTINLRNAGVTVERVTPIAWPPQSGDEWRDEALGVTWHARTDPDGGIRFEDGSGVAIRPADVLKFRGGMVLVHREDEKPGVVPA